MGRLKVQSDKEPPISTKAARLVDRYELAMVNYLEAKHIDTKGMSPARLSELYLNIGMLRTSARRAERLLKLYLAQLERNSRVLADKLAREKAVG